MLSTSAFNAFLKTLEEPPAHAVFILATTEKHKIIPTILSRCQIYDFKRVSIPDIISHLKNVAEKESIEVEEQALHIIAQKADGALRDALSIFDRLVSFSEKQLSYEACIEHLNVLDYDYYFKIVNAVIKHDLQALLLCFNEIIRKGFDPLIFITGLNAHVRDLLVCKLPQSVELLEVPENLQEQYTAQAAQLTEDQLFAMLEVLSHAEMQYKSSKNQRLLAELALMQLVAAKEEGSKKKSLFHSQQ